jgi:tetratricopeptide (TPR) repeat protein
MTDGSIEDLEIIHAQYRMGRDFFERGQYRQAVQCLEKAASLVNRTSPLGGDVQIWLVTAYEASGQLAEAIALCEQLTRHPHRETRKQSNRLLYILKAPRLKTRPEWLTQIPDLTALEDAERDRPRAYTPPIKRSQPKPPKPKIDLEPIDLSQVNTQENRFIWLALVAIALIVGSLVWFSA